MAPAVVLPGRAKASLAAGGRGTLCDAEFAALYELPPAEGGRGTLLAEDPETPLRASVCVPGRAAVPFIPRSEEVAPARGALFVAPKLRPALLAAVVAFELRPTEFPLLRAVADCALAKLAGCAGGVARVTTERLVAEAGGVPWVSGKRPPNTD